MCKIIVTMNITQIEQNIKNLREDYSRENYIQESFIYDFLLAYGLPKASIKRLQKGSLNLSKEFNEVLLKKKLLFKVVATSVLYCMC